MTNYKADVSIIGGGIAGITAALDLLDAGKSVLIVDRDTKANFGGLAKESFGGMFFVNSPFQRRTGIKDNEKLALDDWMTFGELPREEYWGRRWAEKFVHSTHDVFDFVRKYGIKFFPVVHWVERGLFKPGNSVPRFHMVWGTGHGLIEALVKGLEKHKNHNKLQLVFQHKVDGITVKDGKIKGCSGTNEENNEAFKTQSETVIIATGGINGDMDLVRKHWHSEWGTAPKHLLNGSHHFSDGLLHNATEKIGGNVVNLQNMWNYAAGIPHPKPKRPNHGLSIVPPKSALWLNSKGERMGPIPLITGYDTRYMVTRICEEEHKYSWQVLNKKIALNELAVSGSDFNDGIKNKKIFAFLHDLLVGNKALYKVLKEDSPSFVVANSLEELSDKMNQIDTEDKVDLEALRKSVNDYDTQIDRGPKFHNDEQLRRIAHARQYRGDKVRTCKFQKINDPKAFPLVAIKEDILSRKSLGGIQTDLESRVLTKPINGKQKPIYGLYAVGEAAGFGGGGSHGIRALEGTFLASCILTAQMAAKNITEGA